MITSPTSGSFVEGLSISLSCNSSGFPQPNITWIFNNSVTLANNQETIWLTNIGSLNSGLYHCIFQNAVGSTTSSTAVLTVYSKQNLSHNSSYVAVAYVY